MNSDEPWELVPREVAPELEDGYPHATHPPPPVRFAEWTEQLESATADRLHLFMSGGTGDLNWSHTEIGGE